MKNFKAFILGALTLLFALQAPAPVHAQRIYGASGGSASIVQNWPKTLSTEIAQYGDSRVAMDHGIALAQGYTVVWRAVDSIGGWIERQSGGKVTLPYDLNFGVAGETSTQILARIAPVLASRADVVLIPGGVTNDRSTMTADDSIANQLSMITQITAVGKKVILISELPRGNSSGGGLAQRLTGTQLQYSGNVRRWQLDTASRIPGVYVVDSYLTMAASGTTIGDVDAAKSDTSGLHPNATGAKAIADLVLPIINQLYPSYTYWPDPDTSFPWTSGTNPRGNLLTNGAMTGTGGSLGTGNTGSVATGWVAQRNAALTGGTTTGLTLGKSTMTFNGISVPSQTITLAGTTSATASPQAEVRVALPTANLTAGDVVYADCYVEVTGGTTGISTVQVLIAQFSSTNGYEQRSATPSSYGGIPVPAGGYVGATRLYMRTPNVVVVSDLQSGLVTLRIDLLTSTALSGTVSMAQCGLRKVL